MSTKSGGRTPTNPGVNAETLLRMLSGSTMKSPESQLERLIQEAEDIKSKNQRVFEEVKDVLEDVSNYDFDESDAQELKDAHQTIVEMEKEFKDLEERAERVREGYDSIRERIDNILERKTEESVEG